MVTDLKNSFERFVQANGPTPVTRLDYIRSIYKSIEIPTDFVLCFAELFSPRILICDGKVFVTDLFDNARYDSFLKSGHSISSAQFWTNLLEITGLFDDLPHADAIKLAKNISDSWNFKIKNECEETAGQARVIYDETTNEIFVSIGVPD